MSRAWMVLLMAGCGVALATGHAPQAAEALLESGFTVVEQDGDGIYVVSHEDSDGLLTVQIYYEGGSGTIQITDKR